MNSVQYNSWRSNIEKLRDSLPILLSQDYHEYSPVACKPESRYGNRESIIVLLDSSVPTYYEVKAILLRGKEGNETA